MQTELDGALTGINVNSWAARTEGSTRVLWFSDVDISQYKPGDSVRVIRYNPNKETYTAGYMIIGSNTDNGETYNVFKGGTGQEWTEAAGQDDISKQSYLDTLSVFNSIPLTKSN